MRAAMTVQAIFQIVGAWIWLLVGGKHFPPDQLPVIYAIQNLGMALIAALLAIAWRPNGK